MAFLSKLQRSVLTVALLFLTIMTALRAITWFLFKPAGGHVPAASQSFLSGFGYDAGIVAILVLSLLVSGSFKALAPFSTKAGKRLWLTLTTCFAILLVLFYSIDFFLYTYFSGKLDAAALALANNEKIPEAMIGQTYPVIRILIAMIVIMILMHLLLKRIYRQIA